MRSLTETRLRTKRQSSARPVPAEARLDAGCPATTPDRSGRGVAGHEGQPSVCRSAPPRRRPPRTAIAADPVGDQPARRPEEVLACGRPFFVALDIDEQHHVATGIIPVDGDFVRGILSLDRQDGFVRLEVCLGPASAPQVPELLELSQRTRLTRGWRDREDRLAWLRTESACFGEDAAAIRAVAKEMWRALQDPVVLGILAGNAGSVQRLEAGKRGAA